MEKVLDLKLRKINVDYVVGGERVVPKLTDGMPDYFNCVKIEDDLAVLIEDDKYESAYVPLMILKNSDSKMFFANIKTKDGELIYGREVSDYPDHLYNGYVSIVEVVADTFIDLNEDLPHKTIKVGAVFKENDDLYMTEFLQEFLTLGNHGYTHLTNEVRGNLVVCDIDTYNYLRRTDFKLNSIKLSNGSLCSQSKAIAKDFFRIIDRQVKLDIITEIYVEVIDGKHKKIGNLV